ncbi:MAG: DUF4430 domain-containing protein [Candidatus Jorgensenbacteria bacterium]
MKSKLLTFLIVFSVVFSVLLLPTAYGDVSSAVAYLKAKSPNPWITMALVANNEAVNVDYLKSTTGANAVNYEAPILAITAAGENPRTFPDEDLVAKLKSFHSDGQIGDASILNDDIFGVLALLAASEPASDSAVMDAKNFILDNQNTNGGWSFAVGGGSDTNMTSTAIMALLEAGVAKTDSHIVNAISYLKSAQNDDGGFSYDPQSPWGTGSDASSDAWVISAINKLGEDPDGSSWSKNGNSPVDNLLSLQTTGGYFEYQEGTGEDSFSPVTTSYAVIALTGKYYPVGVTFTPVIPNVDYKIEGSDGTVCKGSVDAPNALDLVVIVAPTCGFTYEIVDTSFGPYLKKIGDNEAHDLVGWLYAVNFAIPNIGAVDYNLESGDYVIWHFGNFDWQPGGSEIDLSVNLTPTSGSDGGSGDGGETGGGEVSFSVNVSGGGSGLNFGDVSPGGSNSGKVVIKNDGSGDIYVESAVSGDQVFRNYLEIDGVSWRDFGTDLVGNEEVEKEINLNIPSSYSATGLKEGKLIFWAVSKE